MFVLVELELIGLWHLIVESGTIVLWFCVQ